MKGVNKSRRFRFPMLQSQGLNRSIVLPISTLGGVVLIFFLSFGCESVNFFNWQGIRPEIRDTVKLIEQYGSVTSKAVGPAGKTPRQWYRRKWLMKNATESELRKLIDYPSGVVKATAYEGLIRKPDSDKYQLLNEALSDTTTFFYYEFGCGGSLMMIGEYLVENVVPISDRLPPLPRGKAVECNLSDTEIASLRRLYDARVDKKVEYLSNDH